MRRRDFIATAGSAALVGAASAAKAQQRERMRRIGVLEGVDETDPQGQADITLFREAVQKLGWTVGRNVQIDYRWSPANADLYQRYAAELIALNPDVVLATNTAIVRALQLRSSTVPIVFIGAVDPIGGGLVASMAQPGGNTTGFMYLEFGVSSKWLELLKDLAPRVTRVAVIRDPTATGGVGQFAAIQAVAPLLRVELTPIDSRDPREIERGFAAFARGSDGGVIVPISALARRYSDLIIALAAKYRLPAVYGERIFVTDGGLISYSADLNEMVRGAAGYVDRILRGEKPADLPVQAPTRYQTVLNLKTAKALGIEVPTATLLRATEVIE